MRPLCFCVKRFVQFRGGFVKRIKFSISTSIFRGQLPSGALVAGGVLGWVLLSLLLPTPVTADERPHSTIPDGQAQMFLPFLAAHTSAKDAPLATATLPASATPTATATGTPAATATATATPLPGCPLTSTRQFALIAVEPPVADHPDALHGDLNLSLRGYMEVSEELAIVHVNGPNDGNAPQMPGIFADARTPRFTSTHRVYDWDWACGEHGCRSPHLTPQDVSLLGMEMSPGEAVSIPSRGPQIYAGGYKVLVLYAEAERITLGYTRRDSVAPGYAVHVEQVCVDPNLLALYQQANLAGRGQLPALRNGDVLGTAPADGEILVAVRDKGTFMEPRSRKDWWKGR